MSATRPETCTSCVADPKAARGRYCASNRCLCGHAACPAFATYVPLRRPTLTLVHAPAVPPRETSAWDSREGATWIDSM